MSDEAVGIVFVAQLAISAMLAVIQFVVWRTVERRPHALFWALTFTVATLNGATNAASGLFPNRLVYWVLVNALSVSIPVLALLGFRSRAGLRLRWPLLLGLAVCAELVVVWFTLVDHHMGLRMFVAPAFAFAMTMWAAWVVSRVDRSLRAAEWGMALLLAVFAITQLASGIAALLQGPEQQDAYLDLYRRISFLTQPASFAGLGIFSILIIADDLSRRMSTLAMTDELTGALNRRGFFEAAARTLAQAKRAGQPVTAVLADIDHFKQLNDRHGHHAGDEALRRFAASLGSVLREGDLLARVGGEEFVVLLSGLDSAQALPVAERLRERVARVSAEEHISLTASFGVAPVRDSVHRALDAADDALYRAKEAGRDRVSVSDA